MSASRHRPSIRQRIAAWVALWSLVLGALLPALSHAVVRAPADATGWVQVCSASGMFWVKTNPNALADAAAAAQTDGADPLASGDGQPPTPAGCAWCATHATGAGVLPSPAASPVAAEPIRWVPPAFLHAPHRQTVWSAAHSRAPPAHLV
jgi:Protein of unknown function (DUF2946)